VESSAADNLVVVGGGSAHWLDVVHCNRLQEQVGCSLLQHLGYTDPADCNLLTVGSLAVENNLVTLAVDMQVRNCFLGCWEEVLDTVVGNLQVALMSGVDTVRLALHLCPLGVHVDQAGYNLVPHQDLA
jgi:hypothetical protein